MPITAEMEETISYLSGKDDYALFAEFAAYLHTGVEPSPDIDICFSSPARNVFFPERATIYYRGTPLLVITQEALLLTKMNQLTSPQRTDAKTTRDRQVIQILRKKIDISKLRELVNNLEDSFWTQGWY
ncbi:MAG: hypothetical protein WBA22_06605 [Candidatus Methanofastidiosia archaeon]